MVSQEICFVLTLAEFNCNEKHALGTHFPGHPWLMMALITDLVIDLVPRVLPALSSLIYSCPKGQYWYLHLQMNRLREINQLLLMTE